MVADSDPRPLPSTAWLARSRFDRGAVMVVLLSLLASFSLTPVVAAKGKRDAVSKGPRPICYDAYNRMRRRCKERETPPFRGVVLPVKHASKSSEKWASMVAHGQVFRLFFGLDHCYDKQLIRTPALVGSITVRWTIPATPSRKVEAVSVVAPNPAYRDFEQCLVKTLSFIRTFGGIIAAGVTYTLVFRPHSSPPLVIPPKVLTQLKPEWPPRARRRAKQVSVDLMLTIDRKGRVQKSKVTKGAGRKFNRAAISWAKQVTFTPGTRDGRLAVLPVAWTVRFDPPSKGKTP